ncbi:MAG: Maf family protein [Paracoccaceae bacterium]
MKEPLVLASASEIRSALLRNSGIAVETRPVRVDEAAIKATMLSGGAAPRDIAAELAENKAMRAATRDPERLVLGCDQVLVLEGRLFDKPGDLAEARAQLRKLRGKAHELFAAAVMVEDGRPVWRHVGRAGLTMRSFSDAFLENYLEEHGEEVLCCVGCYRLEGAGAQLFTRVEGDYFSVLGLPLLEVLGFLRSKGVCRT